MSQMDEDTNCNRLQSEVEHKQQHGVEPRQLVAVNNGNDDKLDQIPTEVNISDDKSEKIQETNGSNVTVDTITTAAINKVKIAPGSIPSAAPISSANGNNITQPLALDSNTAKPKPNATPEAPTAAQQQTNVAAGSRKNRKAAAKQNAGGMRYAQQQREPTDIHNAKSLNVKSLSAGGAVGPETSSTDTEHKVTKPRTHAIPIINPLTMERIIFKPHSKSAAAVDTKAPTEAEENHKNSIQ